MAYTQQQLDLLDAAIAQGALKVEYADKKVEYRSLSEMLQIRNLMATELGKISKNSGRKFAEYHSGLTGPSNEDPEFFD